MTIYHCEAYFSNNNTAIFVVAMIVISLWYMIARNTHK